MAENANDTKQPTTLHNPKKHHLTKQQKTYIFYIALILLVTGLTVYFVMKDNFFDVIETMKKAQIMPIIVMVLIVAAAFVIEGLVLMIFARLYKRKYHLYQGVFNGLIGTFFSDITPFASGGQFVQAYTFSRQGVKVANSASILVMHFIVFQTVVVLYGAVAFIFGYNSTIKVMGNINLFGLSFSPIALSAVGFIINIFTICSLFFLAYCKPLHRFILNTGINLFAKLKLIKNPERKRKDLSVQVATFRIELKRLMSNVGALIVVVILIVIKMTLLNSLPYFAGQAMGADMHGKYLQCVWSTSYLTMITCFIPIPGASGGAELAYQLLFSHIYQSQTLLSASNLLWRGISFYFGLLVGGLVFLFYHESPKSYAVKADTRTFIDLEIVGLANSLEQKETYEMLSKREARFEAKIEKERQKNMPLLDAEAVKNSFDNINKVIISNRTDDIKDGDIDKSTFERTRKFLKRVIADTEKKEQENSDSDAALEEAERETEIIKKNRDRKARRRHPEKDGKSNSDGGAAE